MLPTLYWGITAASKQTEEKKQDSEIFQYVSQHTVNGSTLVTDIPDQLAYYSDRHTIWLPSLNDLPIIQTKYTNIDGILLTPAIQSLSPDRELTKWKEVFQNHASISGFELVRIFPDGSLYYTRVRFFREIR